MTKPLVTACKGICAKWDSITDADVEQDDMVWCPRCYVHVKADRAHCPCCDRRQLFGFGGVKQTVAQNCLHCGARYETKNLKIQFCSAECRTERNRQMKSAYNRERYQMLQKKKKGAKGAKRK